MRRTRFGPGSQRAADSAAQLLKQAAAGDQAALNEATAQLRSVLAHTGPGDPDLAGRLSNLGAALRLQFARTGSQEDLTEAIAAARHAVAVTRPGDPDALLYWINLFSVLAARADGEGDAADLDQAIAAGRNVRILAPPLYPDLVRLLSQLANLLGVRFTRTDDPADLEEEISVLRAAVAAAPPAGTVQVHVLRGVVSTVQGEGSEAARTRASLALYLSGALASRAEMARNGPGPARADADEAVSQARSAVAEVTRLDQNETWLPTRAHAVLASALVVRFEQADDRADLDQAVVAARTAADQAADDPAILGALGRTLLTRYQSFGDVADLDDGIGAKRKAVDCASADPHARASHLSDLSMMLRIRFWRTAMPDDLDEAVDAARQALTTPGTDDADRAKYLTSLAGALHARYWRSGQIESLDEAISALRAALALAPAGGASYPSYLGNLGLVLNLRAIRAGSAEDQAEAAELLRQAVAALPAGDPSRTKYLADLGAVYLGQADQRNDMAALDQAIACLAEAVPATPAEHPDRSVRVGNLSNAQVLRYEATRRPADLEDAITTARAALAATPADHPSRSTALMNLGARLLSRFELGGAPADLKESVGYARESVAACPPGHPLAADCLRMLGDSLMARFDATGDEQARQEALADWRAAVRHATAPVSSRIWAAISWGKATAAQRRFDLAEEGYSEAVALLPLLAWRGLDRLSQEMQLARLPGIASDAAACAIAAGHPQHAVELLEHGRSILWSQRLELRGELEELRTAVPDLASRLESLRGLLDQAGAEPDLGQDGVPVGPAAAGGPRQAQSPAQNLADVRMRQASEWDHVLEQVRLRPGFETFLSAPDFAGLAGVAAGRTVVIINVSSLGCDALALTAAGLRVIPLPGLTREDARNRANVFLGALRSAATAADDAAGQAADHDGQAADHDGQAADHDGQAADHDGRAADHDDAVIRDVLGWLADAVTGPILTALRDDLAAPGPAASGPGSGGVPPARSRRCPCMPLASTRLTPLMACSTTWSRRTRPRCGPCGTRASGRLPAGQPAGRPGRADGHHAPDAVPAGRRAAGGRDGGGQYRRALLPDPDEAPDGADGHHRAGPGRARAGQRRALRLPRRHPLRRSFGRRPFPAGRADDHPPAIRAAARRGRAGLPVRMRVRGGKPAAPRRIDDDGRRRPAGRVPQCHRDPVVRR